MERTYRNVNDAFRDLVTFFHERKHKEEETRNGRVYRRGPTIIRYNRPWERVLFNDARDANPFFHLYEAMWMLSGRDDVAPLTYFVSQMKEFSDNGVDLNGAYGKRWREWEERQRDVDGCTDSIDQIQELIEHLTLTPNSRRAVLQMWDPEKDLLRSSKSKDVCCNLCVMFEREEHEIGGQLHMTVVNRSNDMIWGMLGANYVHFSFLQEYVALALGLEVGSYTQFSNNLHVYQWNWKPEEWLEWYKDPKNPGAIFYPARYDRLYQDRKTFDKELALVMREDPSKGFINPSFVDLKEPFLTNVLIPMVNTHYHYKEWKKGGEHSETSGLALVGEYHSIQAADWKQAARIWLRKRGWNL